jgi:hypothetical protein
MKRKDQPGLFDAQEFPLLFAPEQADKPDVPPLPAPAWEPYPETDNGRDWGDFDSVIGKLGTNICTLDGAPARVIGNPRDDEFATIEPVDVDSEPMRCCWDVVDMAMSEHGAFARSDDDTDD